MLNPNCASQHFLPVPIQVAQDSFDRTPGGLSKPPTETPTHKNAGVGNLLVGRPLYNRCRSCGKAWPTFQTIPLPRTLPVQCSAPGTGDVSSRRAPVAFKSRVATLVASQSLPTYTFVPAESPVRATLFCSSSAFFARQNPMPAAPGLAIPTRRAQAPPTRCPVRSSNR